MTKRVKKTKCGGLRKKLRVVVAKIFFKGEYAGEGKGEKMRGMLRKKIEGGGLLRIFFLGGYDQEGKEDQMRRLRKN